MQDLRGKRVTVAGLGKFGGQIAAAKWLVAQGAKVLVTDKSPADKLASSRKELDGLPIEWRLGEHREADFTSADLIVASPAIPPHNAYLSAAREAGVPITTEIGSLLSVVRRGALSASRGPRANRRRPRCSARCSPRGLRRTSAGTSASRCCSSSTK
jgi:UDP-N-acetylmuramoylalanine-D-glutamate ligase